MSEAGWSVAVGLRLSLAGPLVLREPVTEDDLMEPLSECWFEHVIRRGHPEVGLDALDSRVVPSFSEDGATCLGYTIEIVGPGELEGSREFTVNSLEQVASRGANRLIARGELRHGDPYYFVLDARRGNGDVAPAPSEDEGFAVRATRQPVETVELPLAPLLARSRVVGAQDADLFPVIYTESAFDRADRISRRGADRSPPVETGGVLVGFLASCPERGDVFVVVTDVLEATEAEEKSYSLYYSSRTWAAIQTVLQAMQSQPATRAHRIVGQCHGHPFVPGEGQPCEACPHLEVCGRSSVFVSRDDESWSRAIFRGQPWQLSQIFGWNARGERVHGLFGLRDGRLQQRGFRVVSAID